jgi:hypothetical protein
MQAKEQLGSGADGLHLSRTKEFVELNQHLPALLLCLQKTEPKLLQLKESVEKYRILNR